MPVRINGHILPPDVARRYRQARKAMKLLGEPRRRGRQDRAPTGLAGGEPFSEKIRLTPAQFAARHSDLRVRGEDSAAAQLTMAWACETSSANLLNHAARLLASEAAEGDAILCLERAVTLEPDCLEWRVNVAILLNRQNRPQEATDHLLAAESFANGNARYWSVRALVERACGDPLAARACYEAALRIAPGNRRYLHGQARAALEAGSDDASALYERLAASGRGDREAWLGLAQALDISGDHRAALSLLHAIVDSAPDWEDAHALLAEIRSSFLGPDSCLDPLERALAALPTSPGLGRLAIKLNASLGRLQCAADSAAQAYRATLQPDFRILEAEYIAQMGDVARAGEMIGSINGETKAAHLLELRQLLRSGRIEEARLLSDTMLKIWPGDIETLALADIVWRLLSDERHERFHGPRSIMLYDMGMGPEELKRVSTWLESLHSRSRAPLGQSVHGGTQTRGALFQRHEPVARSLGALATAAVEVYRTARMDATADNRTSPAQIIGSWSVRLLTGGRHVEHIHPQGRVSAVLHIGLPHPASCGARQEGWLELGRPPAHLGIDLPPLAVVEPRAGQCVLFPSSLYHGTRAFGNGSRLSIAFDANWRGVAPDMA